MRELPILFSTPMVRAILNGTKTETRRTKGLKDINIRPEDWHPIVNGNDFVDFQNMMSGTEIKRIKKPYQIGDFLWVKETHQWVGFDADGEDLMPDGMIIYRADKGAQEHLDCTEEAKWHPSLFMPKIAARIWLEVLDVTIMKLGDMKEQDCINEGIENWDIPYRDDTQDYYKNYSKGATHDYDEPKESFQSLWESINGPDSWNPEIYTCVIKFRRVEK